MSLKVALNAFRSSPLVSWKSTGRLQQTIANCVEKTGTALHTGKTTTVKIWPEFAGAGRYFDFNSNSIPASIDFAAKESPLCTTLCEDGRSVRTVEHLLSALEATGVDNCRIEIDCSDDDEDDRCAEVPIFDGSAREWVEAIEQVGLTVTTDRSGNNCEKLAPFLNEPVHVRMNDSFIAAFPSPEVHISYGIDFRLVPAIGCQWFSSIPLNDSFYAKEIAPSRTFCIYEEVEQMRKAGLIKGGSAENAIVCRRNAKEGKKKTKGNSATRGWLNPPLNFPDEPCRHKVLDLIGDLALFARNGSQGLPVAHIVVYK
ncbi:hypothetical protein RJ639_033186, partial [Escallonia herrerae]